MIPGAPRVAALCGAIALLCSARASAQESKASAANPRPRFVVESVSQIDLEGPASAPQWSPDGEWIAFSMPKGNGIGIVRPDGSAFRSLTSEPGSGYKFAWSPDGSRIAFRTARREKGARQYAIRVLEVASAEIETSTDTIADVQPPTWQRGPDGVRWVSHAPGGPLAGGWRGVPPALRKDAPGPPLLITQGRSLALHSADAAKRRKLSGEIGLNPVWDNAGSRIAFDAQDQIAIASPDEGRGPRTLCVGQHPAWSPGGDWIVYQITRDHSHVGEDGRQHTADTLPHLHDDKTNHRIVDSDLWFIRPDGSDRQQLTFTTDVIEVDPHWSPDGNRIVCGTEEWGKLLVLKLARQ